MPRTETTTRTLYKFDELSEAAKEKAREWWRKCESEDPHSADAVIEDAATIADLFGLDIRQTMKVRVDKSYFYVPTVYFSGFWSQGDGACFEGSYSYKKGALQAVKQYASQDKELHRIVSTLQDVQRRYFYELTASCKHSGHYYHSGCMYVSVECDRREVTVDDEETVTQALRDFADWIYKQLEAEYDYTMSDENVDESIRINEYEFTEAGEIA